MEHEAGRAGDEVAEPREPGGEQGCLPPTPQLVAAALALTIGAAVGLTGHPVAAGIAFIAGVVLYIASSTPDVRLVAAAYTLGVHAAYLSRLASEKTILPFIIIERGPIGATLYPDIAQILVANEAYTRYKACKRKTLKPTGEAQGDGPPAGVVPR